MKIRLVLAGLELVAFIFLLIVILQFWWTVPQSAPFWQTVGYVFAFLGIACAWCILVLFTLLAGSRR